MGTTKSVVMGDRGHIVVPQALREDAHWSQGTPLLLIPFKAGLMLVSRDRGLEIVREQLQGHDVVGQLLEERRHLARQEDQDGAE